VDKGVSAVFLGSYMKFLLPYFDGNNHKDRLANVFLEICQYYKEDKVTSCLDNLRLTTLGKAGKTPTLNCKAGEARFLVPWAAASAARKLGDSEDEVAVKEMAAQLLSCYNCLSRASYNPQLPAQARAIGRARPPLRKARAPPRADKQVCTGSRARAHTSKNWTLEAGS
jgi:hypothetical protein